VIAQWEYTSYALLLKMVESDTFSLESLQVPKEFFIIPSTASDEKDFPDQNLSVQLDLTARHHIFKSKHISEKNMCKWTSHY